jgi:hypothetical protein
MRTISGTPQQSSLERATKTALVRPPPIAPHGELNVGDDDDTVSVIVDCRQRSSGGSAVCEASTSGSKPPCVYDNHIDVCCDVNVSKPSPLGGVDCPCPVACCAHQYNDRNISPEAVAAYRRATELCQEGAGGQQFCYPDTSQPHDLGCCEPQGDEPTGTNDPAPFAYQYEYLLITCHQPNTAGTHLPSEICRMCTPM